MTLAALYGPVALGELGVVLQYSVASLVKAEELGECPYAATVGVGSISNHLPRREDELAFLGARAHDVDDLRPGREAANNPNPTSRLCCLWMEKSRRRLTICGV